MKSNLKKCKKNEIGARYQRTTYADTDVRFYLNNDIEFWKEVQT